MYQHQIQPINAKVRTWHSPTIIRERAAPEATGSFHPTEEEQQTHQKLTFKDIVHNPICSGSRGAIEQNVDRRHQIFKGSIFKQFVPVVQNDCTLRQGDSQRREMTSELKKDKGRGNTQIPPRTCPQPDQFSILETKSLEKNETPPLVKIAWTGAQVVHHFSLPRRATENGTSIVFYDASPYTSSTTTADGAPRTSMVADQAVYGFIETMTSSGGNRTRPLSSHPYNTFPIEHTPNVYYSQSTQASPPPYTATSLVNDEAGSGSVDSNFPASDGSRAIPVALSNSMTATPLVDIAGTGAHVVTHFSVPRRPTEDGTRIVFYDAPTDTSSSMATDSAPRTSVAGDQAGYNFINLDEAPNAAGGDRTRPLSSHPLNTFEQTPQIHYNLYTQAIPPCTASTSIAGDEAGCDPMESDVLAGDDSQDVSPTPSSNTTGTGTAQEDPKQAQRPQTNATSPDIKDRFVFLTKRSLEEALIPLTGE